MAMNMNVSFKKGLKASLPSTRDANTFYYVSDEFALYLGDHLISNEVTLEMFNALAARVKTLEDWKATLTEITKDNGTADLIKVSVTTENGAVKTVTVDDSALDTKLEDNFKAATDYTDQEINKITTGAGYATTKYVDDAIDALDANVTSTTPEAGKGIQVGVTEVDGVITAVTVSGNYDEKYDAKGAAAAAEQKAKEYADEIKADLLGDSDTLVGTYDTLREINAWINGEGVNTTELTEAIAAETKNRTDADTAINETIAGVKATAEAAYVKPVAGIAKADLATDVQTSLGKADTALQTHQDISGKADKVTTATSGNFAGLDANGNLTDSGSKASDFATAAQGAKADSAVQSVTFSSGSNNGTLKLTVDGVDTDNIAVKGLQDAAYTTITAITAPVYAKINEQVGSHGGGNPTGVYADIQGATTVKVEDCVKAINKLVDGSEATGTQINTINNNVAEIIDILTWGEF